MKSVFTLGKKKEGLKPVEKAKAEEIVDSLTKKVEANYSLEEVDKAEKEAEKYAKAINKGMKELEKEERKEQKKFAEMLKKQMENE